MFRAPEHAGYTLEGEKYRQKHETFFLLIIIYVYIPKSLKREMIRKQKIIVFKR